MLRNSRLASRALVTFGLIATLFLAACQAKVDVGIDVQPDGSGTVEVMLTLDAEAAGRLGDDLKRALRTEDLAEAGWKITGPAQDGEETVLRVSKPFANPSELAPIIDEISGPEGPFNDFILSSSDELTKTTYTFSGEVNLTGLLDQFSDSAVAETLDGFATGRTPEELKQELADDPDGLMLALEVNLPGTLQSGGSVTGSNKYHESWTLGSGPEVAPFQLVSQKRDISSVWWVIGGAACLGLAGILIIRKPKSGATDVQVTELEVPEPVVDAVSSGE